MVLPVPRRRAPELAAPWLPPLSCAGPRRTLRLDSGRIAATCPGRVGTCLPPLLPTQGPARRLQAGSPAEHCHRLVLGSSDMCPPAPNA
jgi:hypothetical protein